MVTKKAIRQIKKKSGRPDEEIQKAFEGTGPAINHTPFGTTCPPGLIPLPKKTSAGMIFFLRSSAATIYLAARIALWPS